MAPSLLARIAWSPELGLGALVRDSRLSWFDAAGQDVGDPLSLHPEGHLEQITPAVGRIPGGFVVGGGSVTWDAPDFVPPLRVAYLSGGETRVPWVTVDQQTEAYEVPELGRDASGQVRLMAASRWDGYGALWRLDDGALTRIMDLPGDMPYTGFPPQMSVADYQGHAVIAQASYDDDLWLARDDGVAVNLGMGAALGALVVLDDGLALVTQSPQGDIALHRLADDVFGQVEDTHVFVQRSPARSWTIRTCATPRGIGILWGGGDSPLKVLNLECCVRSRH